MYTRTFNTTNINQKYINQKYKAFLAFVYFFVFYWWAVDVLPVLNYSDELLTIIGGILAIKKILDNNLRIKKNKFGYYKYIVLLCLIGIASSLFFRYQKFMPSFLDFLAIVKFWFVMYFSSYVFKVDIFSVKYKSIKKHITLIETILIILLLADYVLHIFPTVGDEFGIRSEQLFYRHPSAFSCIGAFLASISFILIKYNKKYWRQFALALLITLTSLRVRAVAAIIFFIVLYYLVYIRKRKITGKTFVLFLPVILVLAWDKINYYFFTPALGRTARRGFVETAPRIANDHFPLGAGFATFGSNMSGVYYSPIYYMYGLSNIYGLSEDNLLFVSDSYWPMILGQFGWIGLIVNIIGLVFLFINLQKIRNIDIGLYAGALAAFAFVLVQSFGDSAYVNPTCVPLAFIIGVCIGISKTVPGRVR